MTLNFAQVFGENYDPEVPAYPFISIQIEINDSVFDTESFDIGKEQLLLDRMNEMIENADEIFEDEEDEGCIKALIEWSERDYDVLYEWEFNRKEWEEKLSKDMDEIVEEKDESDDEEFEWSERDYIEINKKNDEIRKVLLEMKGYKSPIKELD